jgi:hypothetical protein
VTGARDGAEVGRGDNIPTPEVFDDPAAERAHRKQRVAAGYRMLARFGLDEGIAGHITCRDPERTDHF